MSDKKVLIKGGTIMTLAAGSPFGSTFVGEVLIEGQRLARWELAEATTFVDTLRAQPAGEALVQRIRSMIARNEYKRRQAPPIVRVRSRAFGTGRQMPIAAKFV